MCAMCDAATGNQVRLNERQTLDLSRGVVMEIDGTETPAPELTERFISLLAEELLDDVCGE